MCAPKYYITCLLLDMQKSVYAPDLFECDLCSVAG